MSLPVAGGLWRTRDQHKLLLALHLHLSALSRLLGAAVSPSIPSHPPHCSSRVCTPALPRGRRLREPSVGSGQGSYAEPALIPRGVLGMGLGLETREVVMRVAAVVSPPPPIPCKEGVWRAVRDGDWNWGLGVSRKAREKERFVPLRLKVSRGGG